MRNVNVKETVIENVDIDLVEFDRLLACIDSSEKSLKRLEKELFNIVVKCSSEFLYRKKLALVAKVIDRLSSNELTRKSYQAKFLKSFNVLIGAFSRDDKGNYYYCQNNALVVYLKKESIFLERIDLDDSFIAQKIEQCKELNRSNFFSSLSELYNLKTENKAVDYASNFLKALLTIEKNQGKIKGKNKAHILELIEVARTLKLLPEKESVDLLPTGQANFHGKAIKKVA